MIVHLNLELDFGTEKKGLLKKRKRRSPGLKGLIMEP